MRIKQLAMMVISVIMVCIGTHGYSAQNIQVGAVNDLNFLSHLIRTKYAPLSLKGVLYKWDVNEETAYATERLLVDDFSLTHAHRVLSGYIASLCDYHAGITFYRNENAFIPYNVKISESKRVFITESMTSEGEFTLGDEIIAVDGVPVIDVLDSIRRGDGERADYAHAARNLFSRSGALGYIVPKKDLVAVDIRRHTGEEKRVYTAWRYTPENILDITQNYSRFDRERNRGFSAQSLFGNSKVKGKEMFKTNLLPYFWEELSQNNKLKIKGNYNIGSRDGFLPYLGMPIWEAGEGPFRAYIYNLRDDNGIDHEIGFIRISTYSWEEMEGRDPYSSEMPWDTFGQIINYLNDRTEALVIDQLNNPGGSVFYMYGLVSMLIQEPVKTPLHKISLTQEEVESALNWLNLLQDVCTDDQARIVLGDTMEGYPIDLKAVVNLEQFSYKVLNHWEEKKYDLTDPMGLLGFDCIYPHPFYNYNKPIFVLINEEDFSCADFFPAILKDSGRATTIGTPTAGAGGFVYEVVFPNRTGIKKCTLTGSLAVREDGSLIESAGVSPDYFLGITDRDLALGMYGDYLAGVRGIMKQHLFEK